MLMFMLLFMASVVPDSFDYKTCLAVGSGWIQCKIRPYLDQDQDPDPAGYPAIFVDPDPDPVHP